MKVEKINALLMKYPDYFLMVAAVTQGRNDRRGLLVDLSGHRLIQQGLGRSWLSREITWPYNVHTQDSIKLFTVSPNGVNHFN